MVDGSVEPDSDADTEANRARAKAFVDEVLIKKHWDQLQQYVDAALVEHHPDSMDGLPALGDHLQRRYGEGSLGIDYQRRHRVLADHDFVLTVCEGYRDGVHTSFYDLFRLAEGRIVEHWDTTESVPPRDQWKNDNGKF